MPEAEKVQFRNAISSYLGGEVPIERICIRQFGFPRQRESEIDILPRESTWYFS